jgi:N-methylhydantoinase A/oxoprolinase/acetone carboxylase beta subunit
LGVRPIVLGGERIDATVLQGELPPGTPLLGPAVCALPEATLLVPPGWSGSVDRQGTIHLAVETG